MGFCDEIPLFVDTNLGTHFSLSVSQDITAGDLKDSMAIKHVFKKSSGTRLLHLNASSMQNDPEYSSSPPFMSKLTLLDSSPHRDDRRQKPDSLNVADYNEKSGHDEEQAEIHFLNISSRKNLKKKKIIEHDNAVEANKWTREVNSAFVPSFNKQQQPNAVSEDSIEGKEHESFSLLENSRKSSQAISVTGIISRFFSESDEVDSCYCQPKHVLETVQVRIDELRDSNIRTLNSQTYQISNRKSVLSDTDTQFSFAKQQEENAAERAKAALKVKKQQLGLRKQVNKKSSLCKRRYIETSRGRSCKYQVGKRLTQAANSMQISGNGKGPAIKFLSKFKNQVCSDSASFVRSIAFDVDAFDD